METIQDKIIQLMEEKRLNFQKELKLEIELEKELKQIDKFAMVTIITDSIGLKEWDGRIVITCRKNRPIHSKIKKLFPKHKIEYINDSFRNIKTFTIPIQDKQAE